MKNLVNSWIRMFKSHPHIFGACFLFMVLSTIGQTYLISQFLPYFQDKLQIDQIALGSTYSLATLMSAMCLYIVGTLYDKMRVKHFSFVCLFLMCLGLILLSKGNHLAWLIIGFFLVRLIGQTTFSLISTNIITQTMGENRGKALSLIQFGRACGEGFFPYFVVTISRAYGFELTLLMLIPIILVVTVLAVLLLRSVDPKKPLYPEAHNPNESLNKSNMGEDILKIKTMEWNRIKKDLTFYVVIFTNSVLPFVMTGLFFGQQDFLAFLNWDPIIFGKAFIFMAIFSLVSNLLTGFFVDKMGALKLRGYILLPLIGSLTLLFFNPESFISYFYMTGVGLCIGLAGNIQNAYWAEKFGLENLGKIKGVNYSFIVCSTAFAPVIFSYIIKVGNNYAIVLSFCLALVILAQILNTFLSLGHK